MVSDGKINWDSIEVTTDLGVKVTESCFKSKTNFLLHSTQEPFVGRCVTKSLGPRKI